MFCGLNSKRFKPGQSARMALITPLYEIISYGTIGSIEVSRHFNSYGPIMAVGDAHVFPGFLPPVLTQISFQSHRLLFSHASAEVRGENTPEEVSPQPGLELTTTRS